MRTKNNSKKLVATLICTLCISISSISSFAASKTFTDTFLRGQEYICCVRDSITWTTENVKFTITASDGWQSTSGLLVSAGGVRKLSTSTTKEIFYNYATSLKAGATIFGVTLGYNQDYIDQCHVYAGSCIEWIPNT